MIATASDPLWTDWLFSAFSFCLTGIYIFLWTSSLLSYHSFPVLLSCLRFGHMRKRRNNSISNEKRTRAEWTCECFSSREGDTIPMGGSTAFRSIPLGANTAAKFALFLVFFVHDTFKTSLKTVCIVPFAFLWDIWV